MGSNGNPYGIPPDDPYEPVSPSETVETKIYAPGCGGPAWWSGDPELNAMRVADGYYSALPERDADLAAFIRRSSRSQ